MVDDLVLPIWSNDRPSITCVEQVLTDLTLLSEGRNIVLPVWNKH